MARERIVKVNGNVYRLTPIVTGKLNAKGYGKKSVDSGFSTGIPSELKQAVGYCDAMMYDCTSPVSSATEDTFFQVAVGGQLSGSSTVKKTELHTNIKQSGQLPSDERFEVHGYTMWLAPFMLEDTDKATVVTLVNAMLKGHIVIKFRGYRDLTHPIYEAISYKVGHGHIYEETTAHWSAFLSSPFYAGRGYKKLAKPVVLSRSVPVEVKIEWNAAPNSASTNALLLYFGFIGIKEFSVVS